MIVRLLCVPLLLAAVPVGAALSERDLADAVARPPAGARLPATLAFTDQNGRRTTLGALAGGRPLALIFADFTCRHVCAPGLAMTGGALAATGLAPGRDYRLAVIGIDPRDTAADARHLAESAAPDPALARATALLSGDAATVRRATAALGYGYAYDAENDQFAHDAAVYVFDARGGLAAVLPELGLRADALRQALAGQAVEPGLVERVARLCYGTGAAHGRYAQAVIRALQACSLLLLAGAGLLLWRRRRAT